MALLVYREDEYLMDHLSEEMKEWYKHHVSLVMFWVCLHTSNCSTLFQFIPKYEDLYASAGVDSTRLRKEAWKLQFLGVLPSHRGKGVRERLVQAMNRRVRNTC